MQRRTAVPVGLVVALLGITPASGGASPADAGRAGADRGAMLSKLRWASFPPFIKGQPARGAVLLSTRPGEPTRIIGVLISLSISVDPSDPSGNTVSLALTRRSCGELRAGVGVGEIERIGRPLVVAPNGAAYLDDTDSVHARRVAAARSLVVVGDPNGDGVEDIEACGPLAADRPRVTGTDFIAHHVGNRFGGARFLAYAAARPDGQIKGSMVNINLVPDSRYTVALSRTRCPAGDGRRDRPPMLRVASFRTDGGGSAALSLEFVGSRAAWLRSARSMCITRDGTISPTLGPTLGSRLERVSPRSSARDR